MDAQQVIDKIISDAESKAEEIKKEAAEKAEQQDRKLKDEMAEFDEQTKQLAEQAAENKRAHILAAARMDAAQKKLAEKRKILDKVFDQAKERIQQLPDQEYTDLMKKLMAGAVESGDETVIADKNDQRINSQLIEKVNSELGDKGKLQLSEEREDLGGGFVLRQEKIQKNVSLPVLINQAREELEIEIARELFNK
jgi:V/A-type H+-transporting ATPase subunit E